MRKRSAAVTNEKKKSPIRGSANVHGMLVDDPREEMIPMDDAALDNIPISMWAANHADSVKKIARQEVMIAQLDRDIERAKEDVVAWRDKTVELQMTNEKLMVEMKAAKDAEKERDAEVLATHQDRGKFRDNIQPGMKGETLVLDSLLPVLK